MDVCLLRVLCVVR